MPKAGWLHPLESARGLVKVAIYPGKSRRRRAFPGPNEDLQALTLTLPPIPGPTLASEGEPASSRVSTVAFSESRFDFNSVVATCNCVLPACAVRMSLAKLAILVRHSPCPNEIYSAGVNKCWIEKIMECNQTTKSERVLARRNGLLAAIIVETALGLATEPAGLDIFHEQRTRPVFGIGQSLMQDLHDRQAGVETDEIGKLERTHRMVRAEFHGRIDCFDVPYTLVKGIDFFVDHRQKNPVDDKGGEILRYRDLLAEPGHELLGGLEGRVVGCDAADKFDQFHQRYRIHEVNADEALRPVGGSRQAGDRDRRCVRGDERAGLEDRADLVKNPALDVFLLDRGLDDQIAVRQSVDRIRERDPLQRLLSGVLGDDFLGDLS